MNRTPEGVPAPLQSPAVLRRTPQPRLPRIMMYALSHAAHPSSGHSTLGRGRIIPDRRWRGRRAHGLAQGFPGTAGRSPRPGVVKGTGAGPPTMSPPYRYIRAGRRLFVSLQHNPIELGWLLYGRTRPFLRHHERSAALLDPLRRFPDVLGLVLPNLKHRLGLFHDEAEVIDLSAPGHLALPRHLAGYKVFDLEQDVVRTCFPESLPMELVQRQIRVSQAIGRYPWASTFLRGNAQERWFEETYINGDPYRSLPGPPCRFEEELLELLAQILTAIPPRAVLLADHLDACARSTRALWRRLEAVGADRRRLHALGARAEHVLAEVKTRGPQRVWLAFSHGDLSAKNLLRHGRKLICIDWELADHRSVLHDLQYFCYWPLAWPMTRPLDGRQLDARAASLRENSAALHEHLKRRHSPLASTLASDSYDPWLCRRLLLLEVMALEGTKPEMNDHWARQLLGYLERWTAIFAMLDARER